MASNLYWFYDALVLGIALICLYVGVKRGLMRSVVLVLLTAASLVLSWLGSEVASPVIYERLIKQPVLTALNEASEKTNPVSVVADAVKIGDYGVEMTDDEVGGIISKAGDFFSNIAGEIKSNGASESEEIIGIGMEESVTEKMLTALVGDVVSPAVLEDILETVSGAENNIRSAVDVFLNGDSRKTAEAVESGIVAPAVKQILRGIIWSVLMIILLLISRIIAHVFEGVNKVPVIGPVNAVLGGVLGLCEGTVFVYIIAQVIRLTCYLTSNSLMFLNTETVLNTYLFKYLFYFDIMTLIG